MINQIRTVEDAYKNAPQDVLVLVDVNGSSANAEVMSELNKVTKHLDGKMKKGATTGVAGLKKLFLKTLNSFLSVKFEPFDTEEKAKEWLFSKLHKK